MRWALPIVPLMLIYTHSCVVNPMKNPTSASASASAYATAATAYVSGFMRTRCIFNRSSLDSVLFSDVWKYRRPRIVWNSSWENVTVAGNTSARLDVWAGALPRLI